MSRGEVAGGVRYFRRGWDEDRGDEYAHWGTCTFYLALDPEGYAHVQVEAYAGGTVIAYDADHDEDEYGGLTYDQLDLDEFAPYEIGEREFHEALSRLRPMNRRVHEAPD
ncbi:hypothetical protein [Microbispora catharanthi]|uniref:Uncharacterized protein n=1 Tax=Microbispora catharanthi TaxID=1712871 RepID=A0A5N6BMM3_9ACTN|nr:hypothetical protein [Microbispora catharanthi]KAB8181418.1 hypothetical protein FH610_028830 [Microbispora catharanthi]